MLRNCLIVEEIDVRSQGKTNDYADSHDPVPDTGLLHSGICFPWPLEGAFEPIALESMPATIIKVN
jgi:hypothetical protein